MSCALSSFASINDLHDLIRWLCSRTSKNYLDDSELSWSDDWGTWDSLDTEQSLASDILVPSKVWLSECLIEISPTADLLAFAYKNRLAVLYSHWEGTEDGADKLVMNLTWKGTVGNNESDTVSALLCLPLISQKMSSTGGPDWTCVLVGFVSGYVSMYTENGLLLTTQKFDASPVISIKCRTYFSGYASVKAYDLSEELAILHSKYLITVDGFSLLQTLRACRSQLAKAAANGMDNSSVPPLGYKKWALVDQQQVSDFALVGMIVPYIYDHLVLRSQIKGFCQVVAQGVPATSQVVVTGKSPYLSFLAIKEGAAQPLLADVAFHYASKLKNALMSAASGWLFGNRGNTDKNTSEDKHNAESSVSLPYKSCIPDKRRIGQRIFVTPDKKLATVTDEFGRVVLVNINSGCAIRMWKGYRDAECAWINVEGDFSGYRRKVLFLLIYAPKRGLLEVWPPQQGARVAAFNVPKDARLLYTNHSLLGTTVVRNCKCKLFPVVFITPNGLLQEVTIPFHMALSGKTSRRAKDLHLLKSLKPLIRQNSEGAIISSVTEIKTPAVCIQAFSLIVTSHCLSMSIVDKILEFFEPSLQALTENNDPEQRLLGQCVSRLRQLVKFYKEILNLHNNSQAKAEVSEDGLVNNISTFFALTGEETRNAVDLALYMENKNKVKFQTEKTLSIGKFLNFWFLFGTPLVKECELLPVSLRSELPQEDLCNLGNFLYGWSWQEGLLEKLSNIFHASGCDIKDLMHNALLKWFENETIDLSSVLHLGIIIVALSSVTASKNIPDALYWNEWWTDIRSNVISWPFIRKAYLVSLICRGTQAKIENWLHMQNSSVGDLENGREASDAKDGLHFFSYFAPIPSLNEWESLSVEMVEWNLLISQLEKLCSVENVLTHSKKLKINLWPVLSVKICFDKGKGYISEAISKWLIDCGLSFDAVLKVVNRFEQRLVEEEEKNDADDVNLEIMQVDEEETHKKELNQDELFICEQLGSIKRFPNSLKAYALIANITWELGVLWHKNPDNIDYLEKAVYLASKTGNCYIGHGLSIMMWETWIRAPVKALASQIQSTGQIPRDRLSQKYVGFREQTILPFLQISLQLLDYVMEASVRCEIEKPPQLHVDDFWFNFEGPPSLLDLVLSQKITSYDLVLLHHQLTLVLLFTTQFHMKKVKPFSCFDENVCGVFFESLSTAWSCSISTQESVTKKHVSFLCRVITSAISTLPDSVVVTQGPPVAVRQAFDLGRSWGVSLDILHRHHVCELFSSGLDTLAHEECLTVTETALLASQLIVIACKRLQYIMETSPSLPQRLAQMTPHISRLMESDNSGILHCPNVPVEMTLILLTRTLNLIDKGSEEYRIACDLYDTFKAISQDHQNNLST